MVPVDLPCVNLYFELVGGTFHVVVKLRAIRVPSNTSFKNGRHILPAFLEFFAMYNLPDFRLVWNLLTWSVSLEVIHNTLFLFWYFDSLKVPLQTSPSYAPSSGAMQMCV